MKQASHLLSAGDVLFAKEFPAAASLGCVVDETWRGQWWEPGREASAKPGVLYLGSDGNSRLELVGGFDIEIRTPLPNGAGYRVGGESRDVPMLHGRCGYDVFTLLGNTADHTSGGGGLRANSIVRQDWSSNRVLRGIHLRSVEEPAFATGHLQLERLLAWNARSAFTLTYPPQAGANIGVEREDLDTLSAVYEDIEIRLRVRDTDFNVVWNDVGNRRTVRSVEWATLDFVASSAISFDGFDRVAKDFQDLLTLCAYAPCGALTRTLIAADLDAHTEAGSHGEVSVHGRQVYEGSEGESTGRTRFVLTLQDMSFSDLVPRWLALKEATRMGCDVLFGLRYVPGGYVGTRLLGAASAAESIHAALRPAVKPLPDEEYRELKRTLLSAIDDSAPHLKQFLNQNVHNRPTYRQRLLDLASIPDQGLVDQLLGDRTEWAKMLTNARNDLAHANERSAGDTQSAPALWLLEVTQALLCLVLLTELGLGPDVQKRIVEYGTVAWASRQLKKIFSGTDTAIVG